MIRIGMNPNMIEVGPFLLTWHGFLSVVAVALAVYLIARRAPRFGIEPDDIYSTAIWAIIGGVVGARLFHVIDRWDFYSQQPAQIIAIWSGGIAIWGALLGGFVGGAIYASRWLKGIKGGFPVGRIADISAPVLLIAQAVGRIGDIINGEHVAKTTTMPWGFVYTHPDSPTNQTWGVASTHPVIAYEMIWNMVALFIVWRLEGRLRPHGMLFMAYLAIYGLGRFFISFMRMDKVWFAGLTEAHLISLAVIVAAILLLVYKAQWVRRTEPSATGGVRKAAPRAAVPHAAASRQSPGEPEGAGEVKCPDCGSDDLRRSGKRFQCRRCKRVFS